MNQYLKKTKAIFTIKFLFYFSFLTLIIFINGKEEFKLNCGVDFIPNNPIEDKNEEKINWDNPIYQKRKLSSSIDDDGFKELDIYLELTYLKEQMKQNNFTTKQKYFFEDNITKAAKMIVSLLRVKPLIGEHYIVDKDFSNIGVNSWDKDIFGDDAASDKNGIVSLGAELVIVARLATTQELGGNYLVIGQAKKLVERTGQPIFGVLYINKDIKTEIENAKYKFVYTLVHELTHIMGFEKNFFIKYANNTYQEMGTDGVNRHYINSKKVLEVARKYFNCQTIKGIPLEEYGEGNNVSSHWDAKTLLGDVMIGYSYNPEQVISEFTLAALEDLGYYKANYYTGGLMRYGKHKGCEFLTEKCVINQEVNSKYKNEFFDLANRNNPSCSSGRQSKTYNILDNQEIPTAFQYYPEVTLGGLSYSDYCPVFREFTNLHNSTRHYVGHCSLGSKDYKIQYSSDYNYTTKDLVSFTGEIYSNISFCVLSSMINQSITDYNIYSKTVRALCHKMYCSSRSLTIQIKDDYFVCPRAGGKITGKGYSGYLLCPDYNLICGGVKFCNNMFDCVDKKSKLDETSYIYDYEIKTTQDIAIASTEQETDDNYELTVYGKCPQFCSQCTKVGLYMKCVKCKNNYVFLGSRTNSQVKCVSLLESTDGHYYDSETFMYYKCRNGCSNCTGSKNCISCSGGYYLKNGNCYKKYLEDLAIYNMTIRGLLLVLITAIFFFAGLIIVGYILKVDNSGHKKSNVSSERIKY